MSRSRRRTGTKSRFPIRAPERRPAGPAKTPDRVEDVALAGEPGAPQCRYAYDVVFGGGDRPIVQAEALYYWPSTATRRVNLFKRDASGKVTANKAFGLAGFGPALDKVLRPDVSVISTLAHLKHPLSSMIRESARSVVTNVLVDRFESPEDQIIQHYANPSIWSKGSTANSSGSTWGSRACRSKP